MPVQTVRLIGSNRPEPPGGKDRWDKFGVLTNFLSSVILVAIGGTFTYFYQSYRDIEQGRLDAEKHRLETEQVRINADSLQVSRVQTLAQFMPHLSSGDRRTQEMAIIAVAATGDVELAITLARLQRTEGSLSAMQRMSQSGTTVNRELALSATREIFLEMLDEASRLVAMWIESMTREPSSNDADNPGETERVEASVPKEGITKTMEVAIALVKLLVAIQSDASDEETNEVARACRNAVTDLNGWMISHSDHALGNRTSESLGDIFEALGKSDSSSDVRLRLKPISTILTRSSKSMASIAGPSDTQLAGAAAAFLSDLEDMIRVLSLRQEDDPPPTLPAVNLLRRLNEIRDARQTEIREIADSEESTPD